MDSVFYIFLDIDGVLNNEKYIEECWEKNGHHAMHMNHVPFDPKCLENLMKLRNELEKRKYNPVIILSSTWRLHEIDFEIVDARLAEYGMHISDKTESIGPRGLEIQEYLRKSSAHYSGFFILDDDIVDIKPYYTLQHIHTNFITGFDDKKLEEAVNKIEEVVRHDIRRAISNSRIL